MSKNLRLVYQIISATFCVIVVVSNIISAKLVRVPYFQNFAIPAGLIIYPLAFLLSDFVTEIFGAKKAKQMVYIAFGMSLLSFGLIQIALQLPSVFSDNEEAFQAVLGLSGIRICASLTAFIVAQIVDIQLYTLIKRWTGFRFLWLRNNGSTWVSQLLDTIIIDLIYFFWGMGMSLEQVFPIMLFSYAYKVGWSVLMTPLFYIFMFVASRFRLLTRLLKHQ